jgi:hypothetical protein
MMNYPMKDKKYDLQHLAKVSGHWIDPAGARYQEVCKGPCAIHEHGKRLHEIAGMGSCNPD